MARAQVAEVVRVLLLAVVVAELEPLVVLVATATVPLVVAAAAAVVPVAVVAALVAAALTGLLTSRTPPLHQAPKAQTGPWM